MSREKVKVFLVLLGLNRSLSFTSESIVRELVRPLQRSNLVELTGQIFLIEPENRFISSLWSRENGPLEADVPPSLRGFSVTTLDQTELEQPVLPVASGLTSIADTWSDNGQSILNSLVFLQALSLASMSIPSKSEVVVFARPDIKIESGLKVVRHIQRVERSRMAQAPESLFPAWHSFGGLNDRFAILPREHIDRYFGRVDLLPDLLAENRPYHSERFLFESFHDVKYAKSIETTMVRIRIGGRPEQSDVELVRKRKWYRKRVRAFWKHKALPALRTLWTVEGNH